MFYEEPANVTISRSFFETAQNAFRWFFILLTQFSRSNPRMAVIVGELVQSENTSNVTANTETLGIADSLQLNAFLF